MERDIDRWIVVVSAVMLVFYQALVVTKELSRRTKLSIYNQSMFQPSPMVKSYE